ncbi:MAG: ABC transporter permease [Ktedonobacteraceae bacterium]|nr:ABC transporter permease [Ktedonobacteraceae bacterium]
MNVPGNKAHEPTIAADLAQEAAARVAATRRQRLLVYCLRILFLIVLIGGWELATRIKIIDPFFWGQPSGIWSQIVTWVLHGTAQGPLWEQILVTLEETVLGFVIGVMLGIVFGVVLGRNKFLADILGPYIQAANSIPRVVLGSIFVIGLGLGMQSKVALAVVLVFFIVFFNAFQGVREVDRNLLANARILGANQQQLAIAVIIPSALSWIIASLHTSFSFALVGAVVGEFLGSTQGLGLLIQTAQGIFNANGVFAAMTILAVVALLTEALVTMLENWLIKWRPNTIRDATL